MKGSDINSYIFILIYVDDILIGSRNPELIKSTKEAIANKFEIEDLGILKYYLGINFTWSTDCTVKPLKFRHPIWRGFLSNFGGV